jgi:hypothetical protein
MKSYVKGTGRVQPRTDHEGLGGGVNKVQWQLSLWDLCCWSPWKMKGTLSMWPYHVYPFHNFSWNTWHSKDDPLNPGLEELLYWILDSRQHQCSVCSIGVVCSMASNVVIKDTLSVLFKIFLSKCQCQHACTTRCTNLSLFRRDLEKSTLPRRPAPRGIPTATTLPLPKSPTATE